MNTHTYTENLNTEQFISLVSNLRKKHSGWNVVLASVNYKNVRLKFYDTFNQILEIDGVRHGGMNDLNVTKWKKELEEAVNYVCPLNGWKQVEA